MTETPASEDEGTTLMVAESSQHHPKPFLGRCSGKLIPIGAEYHQVQVPNLLTLCEFSQNKDSIVQDITKYRQNSVFMASRCRHVDIDSYFLFAEQYMEDKEPEIFQQGVYSREQVRKRACDLLHRCDYNVSKARFLFVFPYYEFYDRLKSNNPLQLTDEQINAKIKQHLEGLKDSRSQGLQKWISQIQEFIESRITLAKLNSLIENAKQNKFDIPDTIKDQIDRSIKFGKEIKKWCQNKQPIEKLRQRKDTLNDQKIITSDMSNFEEAVVRSEEWAIRATEYQNQIFEPLIATGSLVRTLKPTNTKIDFKRMHLLVQDYNSLPLLDQNFEANTKRLHDETVALLESIPQLTKTTKTRTSSPSKIPLSSIKKLLTEIDKHEVAHDDFESFRAYIGESLELMERVSMYLEDERGERNTKIMVGYLKLLNDVPIASYLPTRLQTFIEYYQIVDRIKRDITNPNRFQQTQDMIVEATQRGFCSAQLGEYQAKLDIYKGWFKSVQVLRQGERQKRLVDLIRDSGTIIANMIDEDIFHAQLQYAKNELNIDESVLEGYEKKLEQIQHQKQVIRNLLNKEDPDFSVLINTLKGCVKGSIKYPEFISLYMHVNHIIGVLVRIYCLLDLYKYSENDIELTLKKTEYQELLTIVSSKRQIRDITKQTAERMILIEVKQRKPFPKAIPEWRLFLSFLHYSQEWEDEASEFLKEYANTGELDDMTLDSLLVRSENVLTDKNIMEHLTEVHQIAKWKGVIMQRLGDRLQVFSESSKADLEILQSSMSALEAKLQERGEYEIKRESLNYMFEHRQRIQSLLAIIVKFNIERTQKLPQLIRTFREVEKLNVKDHQLDKMKNQFAREIFQCEMWKDSYIALRRLDFREKEREIEEEEPIVQKESSNKDKRRDRLTFKQPEFSYYLKLPLLLLEFYQGTKLRVMLEELNKLKILFEEIYDFIQSYYRLQRIEQPTSSEILNLETEGNKIPLLLLESWMIRKRSRYVQSWVSMANSLLDSVPILKMQELQRAALNDIITEQKQTKTKQKSKPLIASVQRAVEKEFEQTILIPVTQPSDIITSKRIRKQNPHYNNEDITLLTEELFSSRPKKKRKTAALVSSEIDDEAQTAYQRKQKDRTQLRNQRMQMEVCIYLQDPVAYCVCRMGLLNESSVMVGCESCETWFHAECIGIRKSYVKNIPKYYCVACCKRMGIYPDYMQSFVWTNRMKLTESQFDALLQEGREMKVKLDQMSKLELLEGRIQKWKNSIGRVVDQATTKETLSKQLKKQIAQLYLESFWLPTKHLESDVIEKLYLSQQDSKKG